MVEVDVCQIPQRPLHIGEGVIPGLDLCFEVFDPARVQQTGLGHIHGGEPCPLEGLVQHLEAALQLLATTLVESQCLQRRPLRVAHRLQVTHPRSHGRMIQSPLFHDVFTGCQRVHRRLHLDSAALFCQSGLGHRLRRARALTDEHLQLCRHLLTAPLLVLSVRERRLRVGQLPGHLSRVRTGLRRKTFQQTAELGGISVQPHGQRLPLLRTFLQGDQIFDSSPLSGRAGAG